MALRTSRMSVVRSRPTFHTGIIGSTICHWASVRSEVYGFRDFACFFMFFVSVGDQRLQNYEGETITKLPKLRKINILRSLPHPHLAPKPSFALRGVTLCSVISVAAGFGVLATGCLPMRTR